MRISTGEDIRRFMNLLEQNLFEFNVINIDDIDAKIKTLVDKIEYEPAKAWFANAVKKYLINDERSNVKVSSISSNAPEWMKKRFEEKVPLYRFHAVGEVFHRLDHVVDWLNSLNATANEKIDFKTKNANAKQRLVTAAQKYLQKLNALDIKLLLSQKENGTKHHVEDWFAELNKLVDDSETDDDVGTEIIEEYPDGYRWVSVKSAASLEREGKCMGHCVGSYHSSVASGRKQIYSLRDPNNSPHATIEIEDNEVEQIKGKQNRAPVVKYVPYIKDFLNNHHFLLGSGKYDLERMGLIYDANNQKYGTIRDISKLVYTTNTGLEILESPDDKYHLWANNTDYGTFLIRTYGNGRGTFMNANIGSVSDDPEKNQSMRRKLYQIVVDFVNEKYPGTKIDGGGGNPYNYYTVDDKLVPLSQFPVKAELKHSDVIVVDAKNNDDSNNDSYYFVDKQDHGKVIIKIDIFLKDKSVGVSSSNKKQAESISEDVMKFFNSIDWKPNNPYVFVSNFDLIFANGKFDTFQNLAKEEATFPDGGFYVYDNIGRMYINGAEGPELALSFQKGIYSRYNPGTAMVVNNKKAIAKYAPEIAKIFNLNKVRGDNSQNRSKSGETYELKQLGLIYANDTWKASKAKAADDTGFSIAKISQKQANILDPERNIVGTLKFDSNQNEIEELTIKDKSAATFLERYSKAHPEVNFYSSCNYTREGTYRGSQSNIYKDLMRLGYYIHDGKFVKITDVFPTETVLDLGEDGKWIKKAYVFTNAWPSANRYILKVSDVTVLVVQLDGKKMTQIVPMVDNKSAPFEEVNVVPYLKQLNKFVEANDLTVDGSYLTKAGLKLQGNEIVVISSDSRLKDFIKGIIAYEDGHVWKRSRGGRDWSLYDNFEEGMPILTCAITDDGITDIKFHTKYKNDKKKFREYMTDMLDIVDEMENKN